MEEKIVYFEKPGKGNTAEVIQLVEERAHAKGINRFVVASTRGATAKDFLKAITGTDRRLVIVPWQFSFKSEEQPFPEELVGELRGKNHQVHFGTMLFHSTEFYGINTAQAMANLLRTCGQGTKVCLEILLQTCHEMIWINCYFSESLTGSRPGAEMPRRSSRDPSSR
jgi:hypothetical protein